MMNTRFFLLPLLIAGTCFQSIGQPAKQLVQVIKAPKELHIFQETQHWTFPEQQELKNNWLFEKLLNQN
jgi:hypothetical protein